MTCAFPQWPSMRPVGDGERYRLEEPYRYEWAVDGVRYRLTVPEGFVHNMAGPSIEGRVGRRLYRLVWSVIGPYDLGPSVIGHDRFYAVRGVFPAGELEYFHEALGVWIPLHRAWSRRDSDVWLVRMMKLGGVPLWKRRLAYRTIRGFGGWR